MTAKKWEALHLAPKDLKFTAICDSMLNFHKEKIIAVIGLEWFLSACRWYLESNCEFFQQLKEY